MGTPLFYALTETTCGIRLIRAAATAVSRISGSLMRQKNMMMPMKMEMSDGVKRPFFRLFTSNWPLMQITPWVHTARLNAVMNAVR